TAAAASAGARSTAVYRRAPAPVPRRAGSTMAAAAASRTAVVSGAQSAERIASSTPHQSVPGGAAHVRAVSGNGVPFLVSFRAAGGAVPPSSSASPPPQKPGGTEATPRISEGAGRGQARSIPSTTDRTSSAPPGAASGSTSMVIMVPGSGTNSAASPV